MNDASERTRRSLAATADAVLVFFPLLAVAGALPSVFPVDTSVLVSPSTRLHFSPWTNYVQFVLLAAGVWGAYAAGYRRGVSLVDAGARIYLDGRDTGWRTLLVSLCLVSLASFILNAGASTVVDPITDGFHEGEYLGFIPLFREHLQVVSALTVHGPGVDLLPAYTSVAFGADGARIGPARVSYAFLRLAAAWTAFGSVALLVYALYFDAGARRLRFAMAMAVLLFATVLQIGGWPDATALHKSANARDLFFLLQFTTILAYCVVKLRVATVNAMIDRGFGFATGALACAGLFYSFDRGLYGLALSTLAALIIGVRRGGRSWLVGLALGVVTGTTVTLALAGRAALDIAGQIGYWMRYGRDIWSYRGIASTHNASSLLLLCLALVSMAICVHRGWPAARSRQWVPAVIYACVAAAGMVCIRMAVERGDWSHVAWATTIPVALACALVVPHLTQRLSENGQADAARAVISLFLAGLIGWNATLLSPLAAWRRVAEQVDAWRAPDSRFAGPDVIAVGERVRLLAGDAKCLYVLSNESTWYFFAGLPSCSRFYQVTNARVRSAQEEVVEALERKQPRVIVYSSAGWSNSIDGISFFNASPLVASYVLRNYRPGEWVGDAWLWVRGKPTFRHLASLGTELDGRAVMHREWDGELTGRIDIHARNRPPEAIYVAVESAENVVWAGSPDLKRWAAGKFVATVPTAALARGVHSVWVWAAYTGQLEQIAQGTIEIQ